MDVDFDPGGFSGVCRLFPLPGVVLFPHVVLPLHIFEPRYRQMTDDALAGDRLVTIVQVKSGAQWDSSSEPEIEEVACLGKIIKYERLPDGRFNFLLLGCQRVKLTRELDCKTLYRQAEASLIEDVPGVDEDARRLELIDLFQTFAGVEGRKDPELSALLSSGLALGPLSDLLTHALGLPPSIKQGFLAENRVDRRADDLISVLRHLVRNTPQGNAERPFPPPFSVN